jgi:hypothetical protein
VTGLTIFSLRDFPLAGLVLSEQIGREEWREVKLDPEERIIAAALDQAELDDANERGAGARIEFKPEGDAKVTITISRELVDRARALDLTTWELFVEGLRLAVPDAFASARPLPPRWY